MAITTLRRRQDVIGWLARRLCSVVTGRACPAYCRVVHPYIRPAGGDMAVIASVGRRDMVRRLPGRLRAIMTGRAGACHRRVIELHTRPAGRVVTGIAPG